MDKLSVLRDYFGYTSFREGQETLIDGILSGRDVFGIMPTGGGKSLCYQVPALLLPGITVVVSPLISLMQDQVTALREAGVPAAFINSSLTADEARAAYADIYRGRTRLVYVAPERLEAEGFLKLCAEVAVDLLAVDEAHCISQWGQDFRPSYLRIPQFLGRLQKRPIVAAFTAPATEAVRRDVIRLLTLQDPQTVVTGFDRPNLRFEVRRPSHKNAELGRLLAAHRGESGIIYCSTRRNVEQVCERLQERGYAATRYHAGLSETERRRNQEAFVYDRTPIVVATNAFGMGIDKSNVRFVIHYNMPMSLEAYYQEAGRAGRDGEPADCVLLYSGADVQTARWMIENGEENPELTEEERERLKRRELQRLSKMVSYCQTDSCLRGYILGYFGQAHGEDCGNCSNCLSDRERLDITREAQMILSCVVRIRQKLGYQLGTTAVINTLRGSTEQRVLSLGLDQLSTYGLMRTLSKEQVRTYIESLVQKGYLHVDETHQALCLTEKAGGVLYRGESVTIELRRETARSLSGAAEGPAAQSGEADPAVFAALRALRRETADLEGIPAYMVFSDATLREMAARLPKTRAELLDVPGVGAQKLRKYGQAFLERIAELTE